MNKIKIFEHFVNDRRMRFVVAEDLHRYMEIKEDFAKWFWDCVKKYNLQEDIDYWYDMWTRTMYLRVK
jgi:phage anti-repressor protein